MIRWPWSRKNPARELALHGAQIRRAKREAEHDHILATARQLCIEAGRPVPEALR